LKNTTGCASPANQDFETQHSTPEGGKRKERDLKEGEEGKE
jgi:hypothetical protein